MSSDIEICNTALILVGADEITSFVDETREAKVCSALYEVTLQNMLQKAPWRFSLTLVELAQLATPPSETDEFGFTNAFQLPSDSLRIIQTDDPVDDYKIFGSLLLTDRSEVSVVYQQQPDETTFPAYFRRSLELELAALLSLALVEDAGKNQLWQRKADLELAKARNIDAQEQPVLDVGENNFLFTFVRT